jgi:protein involved in polysaccharide export with SLBB domain
MRQKMDINQMQKQGFLKGVHRWMAVGFIAASVALMPFGVQAAEEEQQTAADSVYRIGPQNLLQIKILGENGLQQTFRVDDSGFITHPLVGRVKLAGLRVVDAENLLESTLKGDYIRNPHITIFVLEHSRFSVLGEVRQPGNYEIIGQISIIEAISLAGGFTPVANEKKVHILRKESQGEKNIEINVDEIMEGKHSEIFIQSGDVIHVSKSFF